MLLRLLGLAAFLMINSMTHAAAPTTDELDSIFAARGIYLSPW